MKRFVFLTLGMFTVSSSLFMAAGLLPKMSQTIGQPVSITSQCITAFDLAYLFSAPLFSIALANKASKPILQLAFIVFLLGNLIILFSESFVPFLFGWSLTGLGAGIFNPLCVSIAIQSVEQTTKGKVLSLLWGANSAGAVFGVPFGIYLSSRFNWRFSIGFIFVLGIIALIGVSLQQVDKTFPVVSSLRDRLRLLVDKNILSVVGITCLTSIASLGLYSFVAPIQAGAPYSLTVSLFVWGLGGFIGSSLVGFFVDRTKKPRVVMAYILMGLMLTFITLPFTKDLPYLGLISFFMWGAFGWATPTPQQHVLFELSENQSAILPALNSSAIGLGSSLGTAMGGLIIASGFKEINLPFLAAILLVGAIIGQLKLVKIPIKEYCS
ncbi:MAG: MFS transporter [Bdellovibrionia bacterium]